MPLPQRIDHGVTLAEASVLTANYRKRSPIGAFKGGLFFKEAIDQVISQPGCVAMRYYYAQHEGGTPALVLVGVDKNGNDMTGGFLAEMSRMCPPQCADEPNALNSSFAERKVYRDAVPAGGGLRPKERKLNSTTVEIR